MPARRSRPEPGRRRAGFAAVFGTPVSGAIFGIEVLYLGRLDYSVIFPALVAVAGMIDAIYYTTVTLSTTGYGDIAPVSDRARLIEITGVGGVFAPR